MRPRRSRRFPGWRSAGHGAPYPSLTNQGSGALCLFSRATAKLEMPPTGARSSDERETAKEGGRALLNLGHTFAHAIENVAGYGEYLHGEAVGGGLAAAARLSQKLGYIDATAVARVDALVAAHALPGRLRTPLPLAELRAAMGRDKKVRAGGLRFVVLRRLGEAATQGDLPPALVDESFRAVGAA